MIEGVGINLTEGEFDLDIIASYVDLLVNMLGDSEDQEDIDTEEPDEEMEETIEVISQVIEILEGQFINEQSGDEDNKIYTLEAKDGKIDVLELLDETIIVDGEEYTIREYLELDDLEGIEKLDILFENQAVTLNDAFKLLTNKIGLDFEFTYNKVSASLELVSNFSFEVSNKLTINFEELVGEAEINDYTEFLTPMIDSLLETLVEKINSSEELSDFDIFNEGE